MTTATLTGLKLTAAQKPTHMSPVQLRRNKLAKRLWEQAELARAQAAGTTFSPTRYRTITDKHTGTRQSVQTSKTIKRWWFVVLLGPDCCGHGLVGMWRFRGEAAWAGPSSFT